MKTKTPVQPYYFVPEPLDNARLAHLCGPLDENLRQISAALDVTIFRRGEKFIVSGHNAERAVQILEQFYAVANKIVPVPDPALDWKLELPPGRVEVVLHDGRRFTRTGDPVPGSLELPLTWDDLTRKFADCAAASVAPLGQERVATAARMAQRLEELDDVTELLRLLG